MPNFDFHSNLSPEEFERFIRDLLEIREAPLTFRTFKRGRDGGIDIKCTNSNVKIIGQAKLFKDNFAQLRSSLKSELTKVKKLKPGRYILATSVNLTPSEVQEILLYFDGYIRSEEDILDREQLNKYLGQIEFKPLLRTYSKLLTPDLGFLEQFFQGAITKEINRDILNRSRRELATAESRRKVFVTTQTFQRALDFLENNKLIIISGNPGVGKTTLAHMLLNYLLVAQNGEYEFISVKDLLEIDRSFDRQRKQIFFWDDFWGQNFEDAPSTKRYFQDLIKALNDIRNSDHHFLLITSREYIIQSVGARISEADLSDIQVNKFVVNVDDLSEEERTRIFLNHLYFSNLERQYFEVLKYLPSKIQPIIHHQNYSPRHVDYFINRICTEDFLREKSIDQYNFFSYFYDYLDNPYEFWKELFADQTATGQLILIILLISGDPMSLEDLKRSFLVIQGLARKTLGLSPLPLTFNHEINTLQELFLRTETVRFLFDVKVYFQSPGIKDFLLKFLRNNIEFFGDVLISGAQFFNQLNFVFTTCPRERVNDDDSEISLNGEKILLSDVLQARLKLKLLSEFGQLNYSTHPSEYSAGFSKYSDPEEPRYWKLWVLTRMFDINLAGNEDVCDFIARQIQNDIDRVSEGRFLFPGSMSEFPRLLGIFAEKLQFDKQSLISEYYKSIRFTNEFRSFFELKKLFPAEFNHFLDKNLRGIRHQIKATILDDIDYYLSDGMRSEFDWLVDVEIESVFRLYGMRMTKSFRKQMSEISEGEIPFNSRKRTKKKQLRSRLKKTSVRHKKSQPKLTKIINEYLSQENDDFNWSEFLKQQGTVSSSVRKELSKFETRSELFGLFLENQFSVETLLEYSTLQGDTFDSTKEFYYGIRKYLFQKVKENLKLEDDKPLEVFFEKLAFQTCMSETLSVTSKQISYLSSELLPNKKADLGLFEPLLVKRDNWYEFPNEGVLGYLAAVHITSAVDDQNYDTALREIVLDSSIAETIFQFLKLMDQDRLWRLFVNPSKTELQIKLVGQCKRETLQNFFLLFEPSFEFEWNKRKKIFVDQGLTNSAIVDEFVLRQLNPEFDLYSLGTYFLKDEFTSDAVHDFGIKTIEYANLYQQVLATCKIKECYDSFADRTYDRITVDVKEFVKDDENYGALKVIGMEAYLISALAACGFELPE